MSLLKQIPTLFADWANGIFAVLIAAHVTSTEVLWWHFLVGMALAMSPDIDAIPEFLARGKIAASENYNHDHRDYLHFPVLFIIAGLGLTFYFGYWGLVFLVASILHFLNDLYGTGWGIPLFWPVTKDRFKLFTDVDNNLSLHTKDWLRRIPVEQLHQEIEEHGDSEWVEHFYYQFNLIMLIEYMLFVLALLLAAHTLLL